MKLNHVGPAVHLIWLLIQNDYRRNTDIELLPPNQLMALEHIMLHPDCTQQEVADALHQTPAAIAQSMKKLCSAGFIERSACPGNLRANRLRVTERGRANAESSLSMFEAEERKLLDGFTPEEEAQLWSYIGRMLDNLRDPAAASPCSRELSMLIMEPHDPKGCSENQNENQ